jgi:ADP-ribosylglycohydrolase
MDNQINLLDNSGNNADRRPTDISPDKFQAAVLFSAIGDALGWPTEFLRRESNQRISIKLPVRDYVRWQKLIGGKWWGYKETIGAGEYSDDTQLSLAISRSIMNSGYFDPARFAYEELPLWLHYERGGGRSIKTAARALLKPKFSWDSNFYKIGDIEYRSAGANGAAMRNLPIALANASNTKKIVIDTFNNAITTHGHPRAHLGAILFGLAVDFLIQSSSDITKLPNYLIEILSDVEGILYSNNDVKKWTQKWNGLKGNTYEQVMSATIEEARKYLFLIKEYRGVEEYYRAVGALDPSTRGSGLATVCVAIFFLAAKPEKPLDALFQSVNMLGSDTDTISVFVGALLGVHYGLECIPKYLLEGIQDKEYLLATGKRLYEIASGNARSQVRVSNSVPTKRRDALLRMLAWEMGLHEMFWDALKEGDWITHPTLGKGSIVNKEVKNIPQKGNYVVKLIRVNFECGQTCIFHSRVKDNREVSESLAEEIENALK